MSAVISSTSTSPNLTNSRSVTAGTTSQAAATTVASGTTVSSAVTLSGRAIMLSRLFHTTDPNANPKIEYQTTTDNLVGSVYSFLNTQDRAFISKLYEYAQAKGIDLQKVDGVAFDLGGYRMDGGEPHVATDMAGNPCYTPISASEDSIAQRILSSKAINDTAVDHGFVRAVLNPTKLGVHATDFAFLQEFVFAFSATGSDGSADPNARPIEKLPPPSKGAVVPTVSSSDSSYNTMMTRLFSGGNGMSASHAISNYLTNADRNMLADQYAKAEKRGEDLSKIDKFAMKLAAQRFHEKLLADFFNTGDASKKGTGETKALPRTTPSACSTTCPGPK